MAEYARALQDLTNDDVDAVGGKNASLGEMIGALAARGVPVPGGFATTAAAYRSFLEHNELGDAIRSDVAAFEDGGSGSVATPKLSATCSTSAIPRWCR